MQRLATSSTAIARAVARQLRGPAEPAPPPRKTRFEDLLVRVAKGWLALFALTALALATLLFFLALADPSIRVEPFLVEPEGGDHSVTGVHFASLVSDEVRRITASARAKSSTRAGEAGLGQAATTLEATEQIVIRQTRSLDKLEVPNTGITFGALLDTIRDLVGISPKVTGELLVDQESLLVSLRFRGEPLPALQQSRSAGKLTVDVESLARETAEALVRATSPYALALHSFPSELDKTEKSLMAALGNTSTTDDVDALNLLALVRIEQEQPEEAERLLLIAQGKDPGHPLLENNLGLAMEKQGDEAAAIQHYRRAFSKAPELVQPTVNLANLTCRLEKDCEQAAQMLRDALETHPRKAMVHVNLALALEALSDEEGARSAYTSAIAANPQSGHAYTFVANYLVRQGKTREARFYASRALELDPRSHVANFILGECFRAENKHADALPFYLSAADQRDWFEAIMLAAESAASAGDLAQAKDLLTRAASTALDDRRKNLADAAMTRLEGRLRQIDE